MPQLISEPMSAPADPAVRRQQVAGKIEEVARLTKQAMQENGLTFSIGFVVPSGGDALLSFLTTADPSDDEWTLATDIVIRVAEEVLGIPKLEARDLPCALAETCE